MKKILAVLMALIMILSFAACSKKPDEKAETEVITVNPERGTAENGNYNNDAFGIGLELSGDWYFLSDEEIASAMGTTADELFGEDVLAETEYLYDLYCVENSSNTTVSITYENLGTIGEYTSESDYLNTVVNQLLTATENSGVESSELSVVKVSGMDYPCLNLTLSYGGMTIHERMIVRKVGTWIGTVTFATLDEAELDTLTEALSFKLFE